jgi:seryl-tRNA synthetase
VRLRLAAAADPASLGRKLNKVARDEVLAQFRPPPRVLWRSRRTDTPVEPVFDELVRQGAAVPLGAGRVALAEPMLNLLERLDTLLCSLATDRFGARRMRYPTLMATADLDRCGYLASFPNHAMFATRMHADLDVYRDFLAGRDAGEDLDDLILGRCRTAELCLPPTMCYHTFGQFGGQVLDAPTTVTARGRSFRYESRYTTGLERLWDFTIREIVFLGPGPVVVDARQRFFEAATALFDQMELSGQAEVASDPFFGNDRTAEAISAQLMHALKYELRLPVGAGRSIAVGSFNVHDTLFARAFGIGLAGDEPAASACVGFGLERLAYAVACQHGIDESSWPDPLRATDSERYRRRNA